MVDSVPINKLSEGEEEGEDDPLLSLLQLIQQTAHASFGHSATFDPKPYLDLSLKTPLSSASCAFRELLASTNGTPEVRELSRYLEDHFEEAGADVEPYEPPDFEEDGPEGFLPRVESDVVRWWGLEVHRLWRSLSSRVVARVRECPERHTVVDLPEGFMVPGSRFRELYYWDSYWVIRGLLASKMYVTASATVTNLIALGARYGYVINGARTYYANRSQPPLLSAMIRETFNATQNLGLIKSSLNVLVREHQFWNSGKHKVIIQGPDGRQHCLSRYFAKWNRPRPESSTIDKESASNVSEKEGFYRELASAAESGWDFSSRWMRNPADFTTTRTTLVLPVDLNAFILGMERDIAFFAELTGDKRTAERFWTASRERVEAINAIFWNEHMGQWLDYWLDDDSLLEPHTWKASRQNKNVFASNYIPLWLQPIYTDHLVVEKVVRSLQDSGLICPAGIATSLNNSGQQWDFPNGWAPLQHMIVEGLVKSGLEEARALAEDISSRWIKTNYAVFKRTGEMHEKYDVTNPGEFGGGGEYVPQTGFGWSNGVVLSFLEEFGWPGDREMDAH
ncbi:hypothetical protein MLD38_027678 [Melastoma candidum]|uniref:Uncharacterized protein n=1 Tax=Melastoma candidum TaxID=119954 RepID=A0ACB9P556_9MYRT|nr:hypothetical protein MLD38_027678 [Melastoma candidum]